MKKKQKNLILFTYISLWYIPILDIIYQNHRFHKHNYFNQGPLFYSTCNYDFLLEDWPKPDLFLSYIEVDKKADQRWGTLGLYDNLLVFVTLYVCRKLGQHWFGNALKHQVIYLPKPVSTRTSAILCQCWNSFNCPGKIIVIAISNYDNNY